MSLVGRAMAPIRVLLVLMCVPNAVAWAPAAVCCGLPSCCARAGAPPAPAPAARHALRMARCQMMDKPPDDALQARLLEMQQRSQRRGTAVVVTFFVVILWCFSVPPDIRRAQICELGSASAECVPAAALWARVTDFYSTCGDECISFDFSINPDSSQAFFESVDTLRSLAETGELADALIGGAP
jgi:hypothetical protein